MVDLRQTIAAMGGSTGVLPGSLKFYSRQTVALHGAYPDLLPHATPEGGWNSANNVYFRDGATYASNGDKAVMGTALTSPHCAIFYRTSAGQPFWVYAGTGGIYCFDGSTHTAITISGWAPTATDTFTISLYNGLVVINASSQVPVYWDGNPANDCVALPGWDSGWRCIALRPHKGFLFAIGMTDGSDVQQQRVRWSDAAEPGAVPTTWTPAADNLAGFVDLMPGFTPCLEGAPLRDSFLVFKSDSVHEFTFVGGNAVFRTRQLFAGAGVAGANSVAQGPNDQLLFMDDHDVYRTDGVQYKSVLEGSSRTTFFNDLSDDAGRHAFAAITMPQLALSWMFYPTNGDDEGATRAVCYSWQSGEVSFRDVATTWCAAAGSVLAAAGTINEWEGDSGSWAMDQTTWSSVVSDAATGGVVIGTAEGGFLSLEGGGDITRYAYKQGLAFGDAQARKLVKALWPNMQGNEGTQITVRVGGQETIDGPVSWGAEQTYTVGDNLPVECFVQGRYLALQVTCAGPSPWSLAGFDIEFKGVGGW